MEHHSDVALLWGEVADGAIADLDVSAGKGFEAGDEAKEGAFTAAGGADENHEFAVGDGEVDVVEDGVIVLVYLVVRRFFGGF